MGDFNSDGKIDFAIVAVAKTGQNYVVVFSGRNQHNPVFQSAISNNAALFFGAPRPKPHRLVVGIFLSEGAILTPRGKSYALVENEN